MTPSITLGGVFRYGQYPIGRSLTSLLLKDHTCASIRVMRHQPKPSGGVTPNDLQHRGVTELLELWRAVELIEPLRQDSTVIRDAMFDRVTREVGVEGENRGLSTRLARELGLTDGGMKSVKTRARKRAAEGTGPSERRSAAVLAAVRAAVETYESMMGDEEDDSADVA